MFLSVMWLFFFIGRGYSEIAVLQRVYSTKGDQEYFFLFIYIDTRMQVSMKNLADVSAYFSGYGRMHISKKTVCISFPTFLGIDHTQCEQFISLLDQRALSVQRMQAEFGLYNIFVLADYFSCQYILDELFTLQCEDFKSGPQFLNLLLTFYGSSHPTTQDFIETMALMFRTTRDDIMSHFPEESRLGGYVHTSAAASGTVVTSLL